MSTDDEWVTGPLVDVLVAMKAIQPGDELKVDGLGCWKIPAGVYSAEVVETEYGRECHWMKPETPAVATVAVDCEHHRRWIIGRENIVAWRRPKPPG